MRVAGGGWSVVVPVKPAAIGKSRLVVPDVDRAALAAAIALDTIAAVTRARLVAEVVVVTDDPGVRAELAAMHNEGDGVADDPGSGPVWRDDPSSCTVRAVADPGGGLNAAIAAGLDAASGAARAALLGDVPALRPADLDAALTLAGAGGAAAVPDAEGTGTTLLAHAREEILRFGPDSFARHLAAGARGLDVPPGSSLRRDVDTLAQLEAARRAGLGPRTRAILGG
ncbi:2-phospho-L-lactate guanylyltransferase [Microbacterium sp. Marseille-Q6965]|uniref:2-phospho-L-lactate guanylyltransferase n=1 Tax=Microbacterium sp. Marseille-Q6965 TaxID=2965072 RepID=UPI0021B766E2|nr:2-phospho-L-lactate guanylyltransferase [Microbacterium sp. Marseille-Q6965]